MEPAETVDSIQTKEFKMLYGMLVALELLVKLLIKLPERKNATQKQIEHSTIDIFNLIAKLPTSYHRFLWTEKLFTRKWKELASDIYIARRNIEISEDEK